MRAIWKQLAFAPSSEALHALREEWGWLVDDQLQPFLCSASGDVFFDAPDATIHWLDTGNGKVVCVAVNREEFESKIRADGGAELLLSPVIDALLKAGAVLGRDQCFGYRVMPLLGGSYSAENMVPTSAAHWYAFSGYVHHQMKDLPDGTVVNFIFEGT